MSTLSESAVTEINKREAAVLASETFERIATKLDFPNKKVLDMGCGYGEYMQRFGQDSVGITTTPEEVTYGELVGRDIRLGNVELLSQTISPDEDFDVFWGNNIFEHLLSPHSFLVHLKQFAKPDTHLVLGTPIVPSIAAMTNIKKFRGALASPHINFFTRTTYKLFAEYAGWKVRYISPFFFSSHTLNLAAAPLMPHLYLVAQNDADYRYPPKKMHEWESDPHYRELITIMGNRAATPDA